VLGTLILCFGWYGFNVGTAATVFTTTEGGALALGAFGTSMTAAGSVGRVAMTTTLAMGAGAIGAAGVSLLQSGKVDTLYVANGMLAGLVGITSITHLSTWWGALAVGLLAGGQLPIVFSFIEKRLKIDDVCAVYPVHGSAGAMGAILLPFVSVNGFSANVLAAQIVGVTIIGAWTILATAGVFGLFKLVGQVRVAESHEREGLDISEHGVETYPEFNRGDETAVTDGGSGPAFETDGGHVNTEGEKQ
jgi:Amt family ammonium transporter